MREPELSYGLRLTNYRLERPVAAARNVFSDATRTAKERFNKVKLEFGDLQQLGSDERLALKIVEQRQELAQKNAPEAIHGEARGVARALHAVLRKESDRVDVALQSALTNQILAKTGLVDRWNRSTGGEMDAKARVLHSHDLGICDTLVLAGVSSIFPEGQAALAKDFSVIQTVYNAQRQLGTASTTNDDPQTFAVDVVEAPETESTAIKSDTLRVAPSSMHRVVALAKQATL